MEGSNQTSVADSEPASFFLENPSPLGSRSVVPRQRINVFGLFIGSFVPNWLMRRTEISQGAKLAYGRLAQYSGQDGACFPKQRTLAAELGVSERTANEYIRALVGAGLIEVTRPDPARENHYYFLDHSWINELRADAPSDRARYQKVSSPGHRNKSAPPHPQKPSVDKENQEKEDQEKRINPHSPPKGDCVSIQSSVSLEEQIFEAYPKKVGKPAALRAIRRALSDCLFETLLERTQLFATTCNAPLQYIPNPATWFRDERFNDDPATWRRTASVPANAAPTIVRADKFGCGVTKL